MVGFPSGRGREVYFKKVAAERTKWAKVSSVSKIPKRLVCTQERWQCSGKSGFGPDFRRP